MKNIFNFFYIRFCWLAFAAGGAWYIFTHHTVNFERLAHYDPGHPSILLDDEGKEWARFQLDRREPIPLDRKCHEHLLMHLLQQKIGNFFHMQEFHGRALFVQFIGQCGAWQKNARSKHDHAAISKTFIF